MNTHEHSEHTESHEENPSSNRLQFDGRISIGNVITFISAVFLIASGYIKLDERSQSTADGLTKVQKQVDDNNTEHLKALGKMSENMNEIAKILVGLNHDVQNIKEIIKK
jgi:hypothetical protein